MKTSTLITTFILSILSLSAYSQSAAFLNISSDARAAAMGETGYALPVSAFASSGNTAALSFSENKFAFGGTYINWQPDAAAITQMSFGGYVKLSKSVGIALGYKNNSHDKYPVYDNDGNSLGDYTPKENAFDLGASFLVSKKFSLGLTARYISSDIAEDKDGNGSADGFAVGIHAYYKLNDKANLSLGITNLGSKMDYGYNKTDLPSRLKLGGSYKYSLSDAHTLTCAAEFDYQLKPSDFSGVAGGAGVEYAGWNTLFLRAGYHLGQEEKTGPSYATVGAGLKFNFISCDFAYILASGDAVVKSSMFATLSILF
ncbi:MAG: PorV/PorQ family protein [Culturomica sp.]|jgi:hypothetical protein|nr:PorV/PorQ family protein [Culturomica sp.]